MAGSSILTSIVVAAEWPDPAFSFLSWWPRSGPTLNSHFYRAGRRVAGSSILTAILVAAEWPDPALSLLLLFCFVFASAREELAQITFRNCLYNPRRLVGRLARPFKYARAVTCSAPVANSRKQPKRAPVANSRKQPKQPNRKPPQGTFPGTFEICLNRLRLLLLLLILSLTLSIRITSASRLSSRIS